MSSGDLTMHAKRRSGDFRGIRDFRGQCARAKTAYRTCSPHRFRSADTTGQPRPALTILLDRGGQGRTTTATVCRDFADKPATFGGLVGGRARGVRGISAPLSAAGDLEAARVVLA